MMQSRQTDSLDREPAERNLCVRYDADVHFKRPYKPLIFAIPIIAHTCLCHNHVRLVPALLETPRLAQRREAECS